MRQATIEDSYRGIRILENALEFWVDEGDQKQVDEISEELRDMYCSLVEEYNG